MIVRPAVRSLVRPLVSSPFGGDGAGLDISLLAGLHPLLSFGRASTATYMRGGTILSAAAGEPRFETDAGGNPTGLLLELQSTNSLRNNRMTGASSVVPPTGWVASAFVNNGITVSFFVGSEAGIPTLDVTISGTTTAANTSFMLILEQANTVPAAQGQTWTFSSFLRLLSGALAGVRVVPNVISYASGSSYLGNQASSDWTATSAPMASQRPAGTVTLSYANTVCAAPQIYFLVPTSGTAVNFTLRIGAPQFEQMPIPTSPIPTYGVAATRAADALQLSSAAFGQAVNPLQGAVFVDFVMPAPATSSYNPEIIQIDQGDGNNRIFLGITSSAATVYGGFTTNGASQNTPPTGNSYVSGANSRAGVMWDNPQNMLYVCLNGGTLVSATGSLPTVLYDAFIGNRALDFARSINGYVQRVQILRYAPSLAAFQAMCKLPGA